jgi:hypothetical protein
MWLCLIYLKRIDEKMPLILVAGINDNAIDILYNHQTLNTLQ